MAPAVGGRRHPVHDAVDLARLLLGLGVDEQGHRALAPGRRASRCAARGARAPRGSRGRARRCSRPRGRGGCASLLLRSGRPCRPRTERSGRTWNASLSLCLTRRRIPVVRTARPSVGDCDPSQCEPKGRTRLCRPAFEERDHVRLLRTGEPEVAQLGARSRSPAPRERPRDAVPARVLDVTRVVEVDDLGQRREDAVVPVRGRLGHVAQRRHLEGPVRRRRPRRRRPSSPPGTRRARGPSRRRVPAAPRWPGSPAARGCRS